MELEAALVDVKDHSEFRSLSYSTESPASSSINLESLPQEFEHGLQVSNPIDQSWESDDDIQHGINSFI